MDATLIRKHTIRKRLLLVSILCLCATLSRAQREFLVAPDPVYKFLLRQQLSGNLRGFTWGMLPLSRREVAGFLDSLDRVRGLSETDQRLLRDFNRRLSFERTGTLMESSSLMPSFDVSRILDNERQKYLYATADSNVAFFVDAFAWYGYRQGSGDSIGSNFASLGELGFRLRGTLFDRLGVYLQASNGKQFGGSHEFAVTDPRLKANNKFQDGQGFFDFTTGYLRYDADWLAVTVGREQILWGMGFADRLMFSDNTVPFDYLRLDIRSGRLHYSFLHGGLVGADTTGQTLSSKYIASHRLELNIGSRLRIGLGEAVLYSGQPPQFALMNPMVFLTSADLSTQMPGDNSHNTIMWIEAELMPFRNIRLTGSLMIDDLNLKTLGNSGVSGNDNKFGWQGEILWNEAFALNNLLLSVEYTRTGPFVGSHRTIVNSYTHWNLSLGQALQPNSDEWMVGADYDISARLAVAASMRIQRGGRNILNQSGQIVFNAGSDLLHGEGDIAHPNVFLEGRRVNAVLGSLALTWEPVWQYFVKLQYFYRSFNYLAGGRRLADSYVWATVGVDY
jgi:hypothetical protein